MKAIADGFAGRSGGLAPAKSEQAAKGDDVGVIVVDLYKRILVMQVGIIAGAWFAQSYGSKAPLIIVIVLKTLVDLGSRSGGLSLPMSVSANGKSVSIKPTDPAS